MKIKDEKGVAMVEATIYMPIVLCVVMSLIYLALFNMQEYMMLYEAQRVAAVAAREDAYIGYDTFGMGSDNEIEFKNGADLTSAGKVNAYMEAHNESMSALYRCRETGQCDHGWSCKCTGAKRCRNGQCIKSCGNNRDEYAGDRSENRFSGDERNGDD